jgi:hypothetical protein
MFRIARPWFIAHCAYSCCQRIALYTDNFINIYINKLHTPPLPFGSRRIKWTRLLFLF